MRGGELGAKCFRGRGEAGREESPGPSALGILGSVTDSGTLGTNGINFIYQTSALIVIEFKKSR